MTLCKIQKAPNVTKNYFTLLFSLQRTIFFLSHLRWSPKWLGCLAWNDPYTIQIAKTMLIKSLKFKDFPLPPLPCDTLWPVIDPFQHNTSTIDFWKWQDSPYSLKKKKPVFLMQRTHFCFHSLNSIPLHRSGQVSQKFVCITWFFSTEKLI